MNKLNFQIKIKIIKTKETTKEKKRKIDGLNRIFSCELNYPSL